MEESLILSQAENDSKTIANITSKIAFLIFLGTKIPPYLAICDTDIIISCNFTK